MVVIVLRVAWIATLLVGLSCAAHMLSLQSSFFSNFSLRELVEKNKSRPGLDCSAGGGGGGIGMGGGGVSSKEFHSHKGESFSCRLTSDGAEQFDEAGFIAALRQDVERGIEGSGAKVINSGKPDTGSFYFEYTLEDVAGRIDISGSRARGNYYSLTADLDERGKRAAK